MTRPAAREEVGAFIGDVFTLTTTTPGLTIARNRPDKAVGVEVSAVFATGVATPTWNFTPRLRQMFWYHDGEARYSSHTEMARDRVASNLAIDSFAGAADPYADFLMFCCPVPFRGLYFDIVNANGTASVMHALYPTAQGTWAALTETDGTAAVGATLAQDAPYTWTMPTDWVRTTEGPESNRVSGYWVRLGATVTLDSSVSLANVIPLPVQTGGKIAQGAIATDTERTLLKQPYYFNPNHVGGIVADGANAEVVRVTWICSEQRDGQAAE